MLAENPYVLVDDPDEESLRILTNYDLLHYLRESIEPFLLIEDIELSIRETIVHAFPENLDAELQVFYDGQDIRMPQKITDCSFGHYPELMRQNRSRFDPYFEENGDFLRRLINEVGDIRNTLFHFRTELHGPDVDDVMLEFAHSYFSKRIPTTEE